MSQLCRPVTAKAGADDSNTGYLHFRSFHQIIQRRDVNLMRVRSGEHRGFAGSWTIHNETSPTFLHKRFSKGVALLFPIVDAAPVHDQRSGHFLRQPQMPDDLSALKWN